MWFRVYAIGRSGHVTEEYVWRDGKPSRGEREEMFDSLCDRRGIGNATGGVKLVRTLPEEVRQEKIKACKWGIEFNMKMLKILGAPVLEPFVF